MTTINLKDFYPWYIHDEYIELSEEVADELRASRLYEAAYGAANPGAFGTISFPTDDRFR